MADSRKLGPWGERVAAERLEAEGYRILERNVTSEYGEIDVIALDGPVLVFVEVKTRESPEAGSPFEAVTPRKQRQIARAALHFAARTGRLDMEMRFDVVGVEPQPAGPPHIEIRRNAFVVDG